MFCWYCHEDTMIPEEYWRDAWYICTKCGATWIDVKKIGLSPIILVENFVLGKKEYSPRVAYRKKRGKA